MPSWKRVIVSGSDASLNTLTVSNGVQITGSLRATSFTGSLQGTASYASTASLVNGNVNVTQATIGLATVPALYTTNKATVSTGTTTVHTISSTTYSSAFVDYTISDSTNARSGQLKVVWLGSQVNYTDMATMDIGDTSPFDWDVAMSGIDVNFNAVVTSSTWLAKLIIRMV